MKQLITRCRIIVVCLLLNSIWARSSFAQERQVKPKIAVFSGPTATIQNSQPLVTSNKARKKHGLPELKDPSGRTLTDVLFYQKLAAPARIYVEMFTAHPLENDVKELYGEPDGYVDTKGKFDTKRKSPDDRPVLEILLQPQDGLYPLPYMARQINGNAWDAEFTEPNVPFAKSRQTFYPNAFRIFEEIERNGGRIMELADYDFYRPAPAGGYTKGLSESQRTDMGKGAIAPEKLGEDFFSYGPYGASPHTIALARATNMVQKTMATGDYLGSVWLEGSPSIETTSYWMNLLIDTKSPMVFNAAQRKRGSISADGDQNIKDAITYITSKVWADENGNNKVGSVMIQDQMVFSTREVQKGDARPGGYVVTGGHGGIVGTMGYGPKLTFLPVRKHTYHSQVSLKKLPGQVPGIIRNGKSVEITSVATKDAEGYLIPGSLPMVTILKSSNWRSDNDASKDASTEIDILARLNDYIDKHPLAGFVGEGYAPYGSMTSPMDAALTKVVLHGYPVLKVARGNADGFMDTNTNNLFIEGQNTTATKGMMLLMACILKFGALPPAKDPDHPTGEELRLIKEKINQYQEIFHTH
ncbi:asparaginase domain-containing protein [Dyadobacter sp. NIV53]|uniref:asparaginase domain-containing protein n=1 Tax=Dyadobacter sp. NIV53 TaxID=2861765 RepID=UPI001C880750|nr:asparaginase domain-containing protein [Dyadobacter sp. NIV53]